MPLIEIKDLKVYFHTENGIARALDGVDFIIESGRTLGLVGESGCGKSVTARAIMGLVDAPGKVESGQILYHRDDEIIDLVKLKPKGRMMRSIRGAEIAMIFQEPMTSLNPVFTIGDQIIEAILLHGDAGKKQAQELAIQTLEAVGIPLPRQRFNEYPHQLSGGMRQRAMIAMALSCNPSLLIADEPTTALDVTMQAQVLELMQSLRQQFNGAIMFITHDLGVIAGMADDMMVMYCGKIVESGPVLDIFKNPLHPYTIGLMRSIPSLTDSGRKRLDTIEGVVPTTFSPITGCAFAPRCSDVMEICRQKAPVYGEVAPGHRAACFLHYSTARKTDDI